MAVVVTGHNFESILPKDHPYHVCFKFADWFQKRRLLSSLKPVSQFKANMAWMVLKWAIFKIVSSDPDLHPRWPPSADIL
jgi:hypothetical protein